MMFTSSSLIVAVQYIYSNSPVIWIITLANYPNFVNRVQLTGLRPVCILTILSRLLSVQLMSMYEVYLIVNTLY